MKTINTVCKRLTCFFVLLSFATCFGQPQSVVIEKKLCNHESKPSGAKLIIHFTCDTVNRTSFSFEYWLRDFVNLPDVSKLMIVEKLLEYESDTSLCCLKASSWVFNSLDVAKGVPKSKRYNIQIDALFMINRICWPKSANWYSSYPVLYDSKLKKEINDDPKKIKYVFQEYKNWFETCKAKGKIYKYFPFNDGRYVWFGGYKSVVLKDY